MRKPLNFEIKMNLSTRVKCYTCEETIELFYEFEDIQEASSFEELIYETLNGIHECSQDEGFDINDDNYDEFEFEEIKCKKCNIKLLNWKSIKEYNRQYYCLENCQGEQE